LLLLSLLLSFPSSALISSEAHDVRIWLHIHQMELRMINRTLRFSATILAGLSLAACSGSSNRPGGDSAAGARADSQPGVNAPSPSTVRRDSLSNRSLPTDSPVRGTRMP